MNSTPRATLAAQRGRKFTPEPKRSRASETGAHHEPIIGGIKSPGTSNLLGLKQVWDETVELLGWISPPLAAIYDEDPPFLGVLAERPAP